jgi:phenolic acid decarboxylase
MSFEYSDIPPMDEIAFLEVAESVVEEVHEMHLENLAQAYDQQVLDTAEQLLEEYATAPEEIVTEFETLLTEADLTEAFIKSLEGALNQSVANEAGLYLQTFDPAFVESDPELTYKMSKASNAWELEKFRVAYAVGPNSILSEYDKITKHMSEGGSEPNENLPGRPGHEFWRDDEAE